MTQLLRTVLVDDEPEAIEGLKSMLDLFCPQVKVVGTANNCNDAVALIQDKAPDVVFLDVEMPGGSGFDVLERLEKRSFQTVFVTAYDQYAIRALRINAFDFLLKPVGPEDLEEAVARLQKTNSEGHTPEYQHLLYSHKSGTFDRLGVPTVTGVRFIEMKNIIRMSADSNYTNVFLVDQKKSLLVARTIKSFEEMLQGTSIIRVHKSFLVNLDFVVGYLRTDGGVIELANGEQVAVSRTRRSAVEELLKRRTRML